MALRMTGESPIPGSQGRAGGARQNSNGILLTDHDRDGSTGALYANLILPHLPVVRQPAILSGAHRRRMALFQGYTLIPLCGKDAGDSG